jgi:hypothetical protein
VKSATNPLNVSLPPELSSGRVVEVGPMSITVVSLAGGDVILFGEFDDDEVDGLPDEDEDELDDESEDDEELEEELLEEGSEELEGGATGEFGGGEVEPGPLI